MRAENEVMSDEPAANGELGLGERLLRGKTDSTLIQLFRYTFVGGAAYVVDFSSLYLLTDHAGLNYLVAAAVAFILGLVTNYLLSIAWVFQGRRGISRSTEFGLYSLIGLVGLGLNELFLWIGVELLTLHYLLAKVVASVFVYLWNFFVRKYALFR